MDNLGSEVGQKMRCAVKAKLIELGSGGGYIDDELPDYVMIMVANKRSKQQMIADLNLFLNENTELFVTWLHEVLQKLQEVTLPSNTPVTKESKRKAANDDKINSKREKKEHKKDKKNKKSTEKVTERCTPPSITDVFADHLLEKTKSTLPIDISNVKKKEKHESQSSKSLSSIPNSENNTPNEFDIPTITEIEENSNSHDVANKKREKDLAELAEIQKRIFQAKRQLKNFDELDESEDEDFLNLKEDGDELDDFVNKESSTTTILSKNKRNSPVIYDRHIQNDEKEENFKPKPAYNRENRENKRREPQLYMPPQRRNERDSEYSSSKRSIDTNNKSLSNEKINNREDIQKRKSVHERLGLKIKKSSENSSNTMSPNKEDLSTTSMKKSGEKEIENQGSNKVSNSNEKGRLVSRVIVASKQALSDSENDMEEDRSMNSIIKIKPRPNVSPRRQACKNLLLRAVAEAQRSTVIRSDAKPRRKSPSPDKIKDNNKDLYTKSFRNRTRNEAVKRKDANIVIEVNSNFIAKKKKPDEKIKDIDEYNPEAISDHCDSDNADYAYVPRVINNDFGENENHFSDDFENGNEIDTSKTQFVVTLNDENDKYGKKYTSKINEQKKIQNSKIKEQKQPRSEMVNDSVKQDRLQILAKKIKDKKLAERKQTEKITQNSRINKEIKRRMMPEPKKVEPEEFEKSLTPPLEDFIEMQNIEVSKSPPKRKRISLTPTYKSNNLDEHDLDKLFKIVDESRKVSTKKMEIVKKYEKIPELSAIPIKSSMKSKPKERCKFFPMCNNGECDFFHPSAACKSFPNCKYFADKCLYIHPKCKFDLACQRNDCNYTHSVVLSAPPVAPPLSSHVVPVQNYKSISATPLPTMCRFYPNCSNTSCTFYHPKLCRFGKNCLNKIECNFYHHDLPNQKDKFKWVASNT